MRPRWSGARSATGLPQRGRSDFGGRVAVTRCAASSARVAASCRGFLRKVEVMRQPGVVRLTRSLGAELMEAGCGSRSRVNLAEPCAMAAIPPTTMKWMRCSARRRIMCGRSVIGRGCAVRAVWNSCTSACGRPRSARVPSCAQRARGGRAALRRSVRGRLSAAPGLALVQGVGMGRPRPDA